MNAGWTLFVRLAMTMSLGAITGTLGTAVLQAAEPADNSFVVRGVRVFDGDAELQGVDVVVEHVGTATWDRSLRSLARGGRVVTCGATTGHDARVDLRFLFSRQLSLLGSYMGSKADLIRAARFFFAGRLAPVIDRTCPLQEAADAHRRLESREGFGKIVLTVS